MPVLPQPLSFGVGGVPMSFRVGRSLLAAVVFAIAVPLAFSGAPAQAAVTPPPIDKAGKFGQVIKEGGLRKMRVIPGPVGNIIGGIGLLWWGWSELDTLIHADQPGGTLDDWLGMVAAYPSTMQDGVMTVTVVSIQDKTATIDISCNSWNHYSGTVGSPSEVFKCNLAGVGIGGSFGLDGHNAAVKDVACRKDSDLSMRIGSMGSFVLYRAAYVVGSADKGTKRYTTGNLCNTGETLVGFRLSAANPSVANSLQAQNNPIGTGTMAGSVNPPGEVVFDTAVIDATCRNVVTNATQHILVTSPWGPSETLAVPSCKERLGPDWVGVGIKVIPMDPKIGGVPQTWPDYDAVPNTVPEEWLPDEEDAQPCHDSANGCSLTLWIDGNPCTVGAALCTEVKVKQLVEVDSPRVSCHYGTSVVEVERCYQIMGVYTSPGSVLDPTKTPTPTVPVPLAPRVPESSPAPQDSASCLAGVVSWNPVDWVFTPIKCALRWAFVPSGVATFADVAVAFQTRPPGSLIAGSVTAVTGALGAFSSGGCGTLGGIPLPGDDLVISCPEISSMPGFSMVYVGFQALVVGSGVFGAFRMITGALRRGGDD